MSRSGLVIVTLTALLISLSSIFSRLAYDGGANPQTLVLFRFLLFCLLYLLMVSATARPIRLPGTRRHYVYLAGAFYTLGSGSLLASMFYLPVSLAIVIFYTYPIITLAGEKIIARQKPAAVEISCFMLAFIGMILALKIETGSANPVGLGLAITASLGMSASYLISENKLKGIAPFLLTFHLALTGLIIMTAYVVFTHSFNPGKLIVSNLSFVFFASFSFATAFFWMFKGISLIGAVNTAMILNLEPLFTIGLAFAFLNESLTFSQLTGAALVLLAIIVVQFYRQRYI